jgi:protein ImuA
MAWTRIAHRSLQELWSKQECCICIQYQVMNTILEELLNRPDIWQASRISRGEDPATTIPSGHPGLDRVLSRGGWPRAALTEILVDACGIGELGLLAPVLAGCSRGRRRVVFVRPPFQPYAPALTAQGICLEKLLVLAARQQHDALWCMEQVLRSGSCAALLGWFPEPSQPDYLALRRLQLAAHDSGSLIFLFRPSQTARVLSPAALRIALHAGQQQLRIDILKQRGGPAGERIALAREHSLLQPRIDPILLPVTRGSCNATHDEHPPRYGQHSERGATPADVALH